MLKQKLIVAYILRIFMRSILLSFGIFFFNLKENQMLTGPFVLVKTQEALRSLIWV
jgi:hypothetical protein